MPATSDSSAVQLEDSDEIVHSGGALVKRKLLGRGRSGAVYRESDKQGRTIVRKVFDGEPLSRLVLYLFTGAPNPYSWNRDAVRAAVTRRRILRVLVRYWFGSRLAVPRTHGVAFRKPCGPFALKAQLVDGRHVPLCSCLADKDQDLLPELTDRIMRSLQTHLGNAGFDGLVWQAGRGNPVAAGNFMLHESQPGGRRWFWIDLESGVPALFPLNPISFFTFYLPRSIRFGRPLFDDVDVGRLREYLCEHQASIAERLGSHRFERLLALVNRLEQYQKCWKAPGRVQQGIDYYLSQKRIDPRQATWYAQHPIRWHLRLLRDGTCHAFPSAIARLCQFVQRFQGLHLSDLVRPYLRFVSSPEYRDKLARWYAYRRIRDWRERKFIDRAAARRLRRETGTDQSSVCLTDFVVHIALKPLVKTFQWWALPLLVVLGAISPVVGAILLAMGGALARTAVTSLRCAHSATCGRPVPWFALVIGVLPVVGNAAFPLQLVYWSGDSPQKLGQFLLYDTMAGVGRAVPIWGGKNSLVEAWFNRLPSVVLNTRWLRAALSKGGKYGVHAST